MARVFKLRHLGNDITFAITNYINTTLPVGEQFNMLYTESMFSDLLNAWTDTPMSNAMTFVYGGTPSATIGSVVMEDIGARMDTAQKMFKTVYNPQYDTWFNDKKIKLYNNSKFINPKNGRWFALYDGPNANQSCLKVYNDEDTLIFSSGALPGFNDAAGAFLTGYIAWDDFEAFVEATTWADAKQYAHTLDFMLAVDAWGGGTACAFRIDESVDTWAQALWYLFGNQDPSTDPDEDPYSGDDSPYNPSDVGGGDGDGDNPYDPGDDIDYPDDPPFSIADTGMMSVYIPTSIQLNLLASYIWSNNFVTSMVKEVYADPMDVILSLGVLPFNIPAQTNPVNIRVGDRDSGVSSNVPSQKYINIDCGSVALKTTIGAYIDYAPYTKGDIYIPYVGFVPLDIDAFMSHSIGLKYKVEICTGTAVAFLLRDGKVWQTFACNLMTPVPLTSANYAQVWNTIVGATASLAGAGVMGVAGMGAASGAGQAANAANSALANSTTAYNTASALSSSTEIMTSAATKPTIQKSNSVSVLAGILVNKKPFIQLHRPNLMLPTNQKDFQGYPSYIETTLTALTGYTRVSSINLAVASATGRELKMIDSILKNGFIIGSGTNISGSGIVLGNNSSPTHQINKSVSLVDTLTGTFRDSVDILSPVVRIEHMSPVDFNYVYISAFNRYYFVEDITIVRNGIMDIKLSCDVLESHKAGILANSAIIDKQAAKYNLYLNDDSIKMRQDPLVTCYEFPNGFFDNGAFEFVLCVAGS